MTDITSGTPYSPMQAYSHDLSAVSNFCFDVAKWNLAWLAEPRVDSEGVSALIANPIAASIDEFMDRETRKRLQGRPLDFIRYWNDLNSRGFLAIMQGWPENSLVIMEVRAQDAHERLFGLPSSTNVVFANFGKH